MKAITHKIKHFNHINQRVEYAKFHKFEDAQSWGKEYLENFNLDMVEACKQLVVIDEHTLACITGDSEYADVIASSPLKGAPSSSPLSAMDPVYHKHKKVRLATEQDFEEFRVHFNSFNNPNEYEFNNQ